MEKNAFLFNTLSSSSKRSLVKHSSHEGEKKKTSENNLKSENTTFRIKKKKNHKFQ